MPKRPAIFVALLGAFLLGAGCATHVLHTHKGVSRETTWVHVDDEKSPFVVTGLVGGEQITRYRLLGFQGERYRIRGSGDDLYLHIDPGTSATLYPTGDDDTFLLEVTGMDALVSIELSAHPVSEYRLTIHKVR